MEEIFLSWAAGIFDGEGSALIEKTGEHSYQVVIAIATTDHNISDPIMQSWGGHHRKNRDLNTWGTPGHAVFKMDHTVYFSEEEGYRFLLDVLPYVKTKKKDIMIVLQAIASLPPVQPDIGRRPKGSGLVLEPFFTELRRIRSQSR